MCANVPAQHAIQTALGGYQSINELIVPGGRFHEQSKLAVEAAQRDPRRHLRRAARRALLLPAARPRGLPDRGRRGVRHRPAARQEDPGHPRHRLQLVRARPLPAGHAARRRGAHRGDRPDRRLPRDAAGLTAWPTRAPRLDLAVLATVARRRGHRLARPVRRGRRAAARSPAPSRGRRLVVNVTGAFAMGLLVAYLVDRPGVHRLARPFVGVGVLGGWTTFSALAVDVVQLGARRPGAGRHWSTWRPPSSSAPSPWRRGPLLGQRVWPGP